MLRAARIMPDGKADRHILPANSYRSGLRAGRAAERSRAIDAFARILARERLAAPERADELVAKFSQLLREEEKP